MSKVRFIPLAIFTSFFQNLWSSFGAARSEFLQFYDLKGVGRVRCHLCIFSVHLVSELLDMRYTSF